MLSTFEIFVARAMRRMLPLAVLLPLSAGAARGTASTAPLTVWQAPATGPGVYYLDGVRVEKTVVDQLDPKRIAFMNVLNEATARQVFGASSGKVAVVVTKQKENLAAVRALNARVAKVAPLVPGPKKPLK